MKKKPSFVVLGGGGHARIVLDCLRLSGKRSLAVVDPGVTGRVDGVPVLGGDELLPALGRAKTRFVIGLGGVSDNRPRRRLFEKAREHGLLPGTAVHPKAVVSAAAEVGAGSVVFPGAVVNASAVLGLNVIVNTGAIVEHGCMIGDHAHVATGAVLCGDVRVAPLAHVGAGAVVRQGLTVGEGAVIGAGAVVVRDVPAWTTVVGAPAVALKARSGGLS